MTLRPDFGGSIKRFLEKLAPGQTRIYCKVVPEDLRAVDKRRDKRRDKGRDKGRDKESDKGRDKGRDKGLGMTKFPSSACVPSSARHLRP